MDNHVSGSITEDDNLSVSGSIGLPSNISIPGEDDMQSEGENENYQR